MADSALAAQIKLMRPQCSPPASDARQERVNVIAIAMSGIGETLTPSWNSLSAFGQRFVLPPPAPCGRRHRYCAGLPVPINGFAAVERAAGRSPACLSAVSPEALKGVA